MKAIEDVRAVYESKVEKLVKQIKTLNLRDAIKSKTNSRSNSSPPAITLRKIPKGGAFVIN